MFTCVKKKQLARHTKKIELKWHGTPGIVFSVRVHSMCFDIDTSTHPPTHTHTQEQRLPPSESLTALHLRVLWGAPFESHLRVLWGAPFES